MRHAAAFLARDVLSMEVVPVNELDEAQSRAISMIQFFQEECRKQCAPYVKILMDIEALRPRVFVLDGKTMVPFLPSSPSASGDSHG